MPAAGTVAVGLAVTLAACSPSAPSLPAHATRAAVTRTTTASPLPSPTPSPTTTFDRTAQSIDDPASPWVIVDKLRPLRPVSFVPPDLTAVAVPHTNPPVLRKAAASAVERMFAAAGRAGIRLAADSTHPPHP